MIIGIGIDIINIKRIKKIIDKYGKKFIFRCFSNNEINRSEKEFNTIHSYAKRYAAKEACAKALGTGLAKGIFWKDISVENDTYRKTLYNITIDNAYIIDLKNSVLILVI